MLLDNISIGQLDPADLRRDMGLLLSQTGRLFFGSLRENLTMGCRRPAMKISNAH